MKYFTIPLLLIFSSCSLYTEITYRETKGEKYIREDGFILSCAKDGDRLIVSTFTPASWSETFYYNYLDGIPSDKMLQITVAGLHFEETGDTLALKAIANEREYIYISPDLANIIRKNTNLTVTLNVTDLETGQSEQRDFLLRRKKYTYPTGRFPH